MHATTCMMTALRGGAGRTSPSTRSMTRCPGRARSHSTSRLPDLRLGSASLSRPRRPAGAAAGAWPRGGGHDAGRPGQRFVLFPLVGCGTCAACMRGEVNLCTHARAGRARSAGHVRRSGGGGRNALAPVPAGMDDRVAVLCEPLATPVSAFATPALRPAIGWWSSAAGRSVCSQSTPASSAASRWRWWSRWTSGARLVPRWARSTTFAVSRRGGGLRGRPGDRCGGDRATWQAGIAAVRMGGTVTIVGLGQAEGRFSAGDAVRRGITVRGHYALYPGRLRRRARACWRPTRRHSSGCARCR